MSGALEARSSAHVDRILEQGFWSIRDGVAELAQVIRLGVSTR
jgi:hypothetical protein